MCLKFISFMDSCKQHVPSVHCHKKSYTCILMFNVAIMSFKSYYLSYFFLDLQISKSGELKSTLKVFSFILFHYLGFA